MDKKLTNEEIVKAAEFCITHKGHCEDECPFSTLSLGCCRMIFAKYIADTAKPDFEWYRFINANLAVNLKTQKDYDSFMEECEKRWLTWSLGKAATEVNIWDRHKDKTCVEYTNNSLDRKSVV